MKNFIEFQQKMGKLKHLCRAGWVIRNVPEPETVAAHSWRMAMMAMQMEKEIIAMGADINKVIKMCIAHDAAEAIVGDIIPEKHQTEENKITKDEKRILEQKAISELSLQSEMPVLKDLFDEYENNETAEAVIVKNLDKVDMLLQAYEYKLENPNIERLNEFMYYNEKLVTISFLKDIITEIKNRMNND